MTADSPPRETESEVEQEIGSIASTIPVLEDIRDENIQGSIGTLGVDLDTDLTFIPGPSVGGNELDEDEDQLYEDVDQIDEDEDQLDEDEDQLDEDDDQLDEYDDQLDEDENQADEDELVYSTLMEPIASEEDRRLAQLQIFFEPASELNHKLKVSSPSEPRTDAVAMLCTKDHDSFAEACQNIPLSSSLPLEFTTEPSSTTYTTRSQPLAEVSAYRDVMAFTVSSSPPVPESIALPPSSSPQWKEIPASEDDAQADLIDDVLTCNAEVTLSSSPEFERGSQDGVSSDPSYNDLTDSTLVEGPEDMPHICVAPDGDAYSSSPPSAFDASIEEVSGEQPDDSAYAEISSTSSSPVPMPGVHAEEITPVPTEVVDSSPQPSPSSVRSEGPHPASPTKGLDPVYDISTAKKRSYSDLEDSYKAPTPKRMTPSLAKRQHAKLSTPFRSPLINKTHLQNISDAGSTNRTSLQPFPLQTQKKHYPRLLPVSSRKSSNLPTQSLLSSSSSSSQLGISSRSTRIATSKATAQFKIPLMSTHIAPSSSRLNLSRTVQSLEQKLQLLKRAVKIKHDEDEHKLAELAQKWKRAGREAAWDLWHIVREQQSDENTGVSYPGTNAMSVSNNGFSGSWGWASDMDDNRGTSAYGSNWGFEEPLADKYEDDDEPLDLPSPSTFEEEFRRALKRNPNTVVLPTSRSPLHRPRLETHDDITEHTDDVQAMEKDEKDNSTSESKTLGTMLRQFGIPHETLGWNEDEGDFIDD